MNEALNQKYLDELEKDPREEIDAYHQWLVDNPDEQDPGPEEIGVAPDVLLALLARSPAGGAGAGEDLSFLAASLGMGWVVTNGAGDKYRTWDCGPRWTRNLNEATFYCRRVDAEAVHADDDDAWHVVERPIPAAPEGA